MAKSLSIFNNQIQLINEEQENLSVHKTHVDPVSVNSSSTLQYYLIDELKICYNLKLDLKTIIKM